MNNHNHETHTAQPVSLLLRSDVIAFYGDIANEQQATLSLIINKALLAQMQVIEELNSL